MIQNSKYENMADRKEALFIYHDKGNLSNVPHFHDNIEIIVCEKGEFNAVVNTNTYTVKKGVILFIKPYDAHYYLTDTQKYTCFVLVFSRNLFKRFDFRYGKYFSNVLKYRKNYSERILKLMRLFFETKGHMNSLIKSGIANLILGLCAEYFPLERQTPQPKSNTIADVLKYIDSNIYGDLSLETLSQKFGYSKTYLSALFKKTTQTNLKTYITNSKIQKLDAVKEFYDPKDVNQLAEKLGFNSLSAYYRAKNKYLKQK